MGTTRAKKRTAPRRKRRRSKNRPSVEPVFSAFVWGALTFIGIQPGQMIFQTAVLEVGPYIRFASVVILLLVIYFTYDPVVEGLMRARRAYRICGLLGVTAILLAIISGFFVYVDARAMLVQLAAVAMWLIATWK